MAILRYETLDDFFNDYDVVNVSIICRKWVGHTQCLIASLGSDGFYFAYGSPVGPNGRYKGKVYVADEFSKLQPLYDNFKE